LNLSQISMDDEPRAIKIPAAQLRVLSNILKNLAEDLNRLPPQAPWSQYSNIWKELLGKYLGIFPESIAGSHSVDSMVRDEITRVLDQIAQLDAVKPKVALHEFSQTFQRWLERSAIAASHPNRPGVTVSNATSARGLSFQALFLIGMNEGVFPRTIREDAFLRDRDREVLERDLGYKVSQKLAAFDEEKMLFALLVNAPRERLYCSFQRSDETGRVLAPSWYLAELKRALGTEYITEDTIPRSMTRKAESAPFHREEFLLPEELATRLILTEKESSSLIAEANLSPALFKQGLKTIAQIDLSTNRLDVFDGIIHPPAEYWQGLSQRGLSPTALELYARCPFQYFAHQVLGLERLEAPEDAMGPSMAEFGELGHSILKLAYQDLVRQGYFTGNAAAVSVEAILKAAAEIAFADYETNKPIGYPLIWETLRDALTQLILDVVSSDLQELTESGYVPGDFESDLTDRFPASWPEPLRGLTIRGRTDRIDIDQKQNRLRIVDYKFKFSTHPSTSDNNLSRAALRGEHLQPPFYSLLGQGKRATEDARGIATRVEAAFYYIASRWNNGPLITKSFAAEELAGKIGDELKGTIAQLVKGIRAGQFFIQRGDHCRYCEVSEVCRKNHPPSLWRAENDPLAGSHRRLREKDLSN